MNLNINQLRIFVNYLKIHQYLSTILDINWKMSTVTNASIHALVSSKKEVKTCKLYTLIVVKKESEDNVVLLGYKKRGFGVNKWNGFGGKVESGESIRDAAVRELKEECGLVASGDSLMKHGVLWFEIGENADILHEVHLYTVTKYEGEIVESDEMRPQWFHVGEIPFKNMWPSNSYWLPLAIEGKIFDAYFIYKNEEEMLDFKIEC